MVLLRVLNLREPEEGQRSGRQYGDHVMSVMEEIIQRWANRVPEESSGMYRKGQLGVVPAPYCAMQ